MWTPSQTQSLGKPPLSPDKIADLRVKHLELLQAIVARIAGNSASLKNYCVTLTTAICGLAITLHQPVIVLLALLPIVVFAVLDARFLHIERRFRGLFDRIRQEDWATPPSFEIGLRTAPAVSYWGTLCSWSIVIYYGLLLIGVVMVVAVWSRVGHQ
jgi:hypothetical protein